MFKETSNEVLYAMKGFPYFVLRNEIESGYNNYVNEILQIQQDYINYKNGCNFNVEGTSGDYIASNIKYKIAKTLINKEARFMFSQSPDITIKSRIIGENEEKSIQQYQKLVESVLKQNEFQRMLLQSAKDCFIGKRVACLVDFSEEDGIQLNFYNSKQFYYERGIGTKRITKFVSFENVALTGESSYSSDNRYLVKRYEERNRTVYMSCILYDGVGNVLQMVIPEKEIDFETIPVVIIVNDGTLENKSGVSEIEDLEEYESGYSRLANADIDSERKGMNPVRYTVDMNPRTTKNLPSGAGAYWDLKHDDALDNPSPSVGTLAPGMNHTAAVKETTDRLRRTMYNELDIPDISEDGMLSGITSFKALKALYYPLKVRCDEKLKVWKPAIEKIVGYILRYAEKNRQYAIEKYVLSNFSETQYDIFVVENYALQSDENEEKEIDLQEIAGKARSRKSYIEKWRKDEFTTPEQIEEELMQIAMEENMFDTLSINTQVQDRFNENRTEKEIESNLEDL